MVSHYIYYCLLTLYIFGLLIFMSIGYFINNLSYVWSDLDLQVNTLETKYDLVDFKEQAKLYD